MISKIEFKNGKLNGIKSAVFGEFFLLNSYYYLMFEILITDEKICVFKKRAIFNSMDAIKKFQKNAHFFLITVIILFIVCNIMKNIQIFNVVDN